MYLQGKTWEDATITTAKQANDKGLTTGKKILFFLNIIYVPDTVKLLSINIYTLNVYIIVHRSKPKVTVFKNN